MDSGKRKRSSSPPPPALPARSTSHSGAALKPDGLRVRPSAARSPVARKSNPSKQRHLKDECYSALLPALLIAVVWCFGCYIYLWISLYQSFTEDIGDHGDHVVFNKRKDILAVKLEEFLVGNTPDNTAAGNYSAKNYVVGVLEATNYNDINFNTTLFGQIADANVAKMMQSALISQTGYPNLILGAYLEPPLLMEKVNGDSIQRMRLRSHTPKDLTYISYPYKYLQTKGHASESKPHGACSQKGAQWILPTFHPKSSDEYFESNVFKKHPNFDKRWELALGIGNGTDNTHNGHCPVDADPYLPWIHDVFPSNDGGHIEFIISNKRRCNTDPNTFQSDLQNLEPQVALMQPIPVKRMREKYDGKIEGVLKALWSPDPDSHVNQDTKQTESFLANDDAFIPPRYILGTSLNDADEDGKYTRFICRFHTIKVEEGGDKSNGKPRLKRLVLGETLSTYPYNPEHANYRKRGSKPMLTTMEQGHDEQIWNSVYTMKCPVPHFRKNGKNTNDNVLASIIASGTSVFRDTPSLYLDLIPIRTTARRNREGFGLLSVSTSPSGESPQFDPHLAWGGAHVLPRVEASGRWTNIPICRPPKVDEVGTDDDAASVTKSTSPESAHNKTHFLVACVWASQSFSTRGQTADTDSSTSDRLLEFIIYHTQIAGFDHVYVYDNSDTSASNATLAAVTDLFDTKVVTRIPWPHRVCNNNRPMHSNPGERSSQYAAENSCRARYGKDTTWMASLDADEYLIPTGKKWKSIRHWLENVTSSESSTKILSFYQTRALPNVDKMLRYEGRTSSACKVDKKADAKKDGILNSMCLMKDRERTFMETYNCEPTTHPKPKAWAWRAKKQIYKPDFVLSHFVHYAVVTRQILDKPLETSPRFAERTPFERRVNELTEGFLLHTKTTGPESTSKWHEKCPRKGSTTKNSSCKVGIPSPQILLGEETNLSARGDDNEPSIDFESNCYRHGRVIDEWVPKLEKALQPFKKRQQKIV
ncbi:hypothetical protein ACHAXR_011234 [Thalassiosira sp. AJA248-18]